MPRVSDKYRAARRQQILDAARVCFARNGFHATSMQDVIAEAGLSVGAVYRYFKGKEDLVLAIASEIVDEVTEAVSDTDPAAPLDVILQRLLDQLRPRLGPDGTFRLALQVWAESLRNPTLALFVRDVQTSLRGRVVALVRRSQESGYLSPQADAEGVGAVIFSMALGFLLQQTLTGAPDRDTFCAGVRAVLARQDQAGPDGQAD